MHDLNFIDEQENNNWENQIPADQEQKHSHPCDFTFNCHDLSTDEDLEKCNTIQKEENSLRLFNVNNLDMPNCFARNLSTSTYKRPPKSANKQINQIKNVKRYIRRD